MIVAPLAVSVPCKVCGKDAPFFGDVDFYQSMPAARRGPDDIAIAYYRCSHCEFLFTNAFDAWTEKDYQREIYNHDYHEIYVDLAGAPPLAWAQMLADMLAPRKGAIRLMDYGGGNGGFARRMNELGFDTRCHDPFFDNELAPRPGERFELVNCREVIEHAPDPHAFVRDLLRFLADDGAVLLSTATQSPGFSEAGLTWHYIAPGGGHISLYSQQSLAMLWQAHGLNFGFYSSNVQLAWRGTPACLPCLNKGAQ